MHLIAVLWYPIARLHLLYTEMFLAVTWVVSARVKYWEQGRFYIDLTNCIHPILLVGIFSSKLFSKWSQFDILPRVNVNEKLMTDQQKERGFTECVKIREGPPNLPARQLTAILALLPVALPQLSVLLIFCACTLGRKHTFLL